MYNIGDIVKFKELSDSYYYIVNSIQDITMEGGEENLEINIELILIFPISGTTIIDIVNQDKLEMVARYPSPDHTRLMNYIKGKRNRLGLIVEPDYLRDFGVNNVPKVPTNKIMIENLNPHIESEKEISIGMTKEEFSRLMKSNVGENRIAKNLEKMDKHLKLLHIAMEKNNTEKVKLHKKELEEIRRVLMELEHYKLNESKKECNCPSCRGYYKNFGYNLE